MRRVILVAMLGAAAVYAAVLLPGQTDLRLPDEADAVLPDSGPDAYGTAHDHLYLQLLLGGDRLNLSRDRFQLQAQKVHLEGGNGEIVHVHAEGVTLDYFLETLDIKRNASCITVNTSYCTNATHEFRVYINGNVSSSPGDHELQQDDTIMLWYGAKDEAPDMRFFDRTLPQIYRPEAPGSKV